MTTTAASFGEFFKSLRLKKELTLRQYCQDFGHDPGNISKIERGIFPAPKSDEALRGYALSLGLVEGSDDWVKFYDLASVSNQTYGVHHLTNEEVLNKLPLLFRTMENKELTADKLDSLIELIKRS